MGNKFTLRFERHARHQDEQGSWFRAQAYGEKSFKVFVTDGKLAEMMQMVRVTSAANITHLKESGYRFPTDEVKRADAARNSWLNERFAHAANRIHRDARAAPASEYKFDSLHPRDGEWTARFVQAAGGKSDLSLADLKSMLGGHPSQQPIRISDAQIIKGIRELRGFEPRGTVQPVSISSLIPAKI